MLRECLNNLYIYFISFEKSQLVQPRKLLLVKSIAARIIFLGNHNIQS